MENLVRRIREAAGLSQAEFAQAIGRSVQMVRNYEHGAVPPPELVEKLKSLAAQVHHPELAIALTSDEWKVKRVFHPGETLITSPSPAQAKPIGRPGRVITQTSRKRYHDMLDEIFDSGDPDAIDAVVPNLEIFHKWVRKIVVPEKTRSPLQKKVK